MINTNNIIYPSRYSAPESRNGVNFKYYKIEPYQVQKEVEPPKIEIGEPSGRVNHILKQEIIGEQSFADIIDVFLEENTNVE